MRLGRETIILSMRAFLALAQSVRDKGHRRFAALFSLRHRYRRERLSTEQKFFADGSIDAMVSMPAAHH
jgi:hypothetical protein